MAKVEETRHWISGVRCKTARRFLEGQIVTLSVRFRMTTCSWREWIGDLHIVSEEARRKLRAKKKKKLAASSMLHEAKVAYYAFDVAARFLIWLFMPFLWLR